MKILGYVVMIVATIGMVIGFMKQKRGEAIGKPLTVICALVALVFALGNMFSGGMANKKEGRMIREWVAASQLVVGEKIGQYLTDKIGGGTIVILRDNSAAMDTFIEGIRKRIGSNITIAGEVIADLQGAQRDAMEANGIDPADMSEEMYMMRMGLSGWGNVDLYNEALAEVGDADVVVSLIGLPFGYRDMDFWHDDDHPKFIASSITNPSPLPEIKSMIEAGHITAWITVNPEAVNSMGNVLEDTPEDIDKRFIIVDADNLKSMVDKFPSLFRSM
jgi:hypothetical protein